jgi:hypothetical protein
MGWIACLALDINLGALNVVGRVDDVVLLAGLGVGLVSGREDSSESVLGSSASSSIWPASRGNCVRRISSCSRISSVFRSMSPIAPNPARARRLRARGMLKSRGICRSSRGKARSMAAKRDCSQRTRVSILVQERRNWSASARTRIT